MRNNSICPITYEVIDGKQKYSRAGLKKLSRYLHDLKNLPYSAELQRIEARKRAGKMSIQGVQPKLSAIINIQKQEFEICDGDGLYILKPQSEYYQEVPENEDLTMHLAAMIGIKVPVHGLIYSVDETLTYFIKRFDRLPNKQKVAVEDFSQLAGLRRETKYDFSMERLIPIIDKYCSFPIIEKKELFLRTLFNFLIGNEDMHVKNFSLITKDNKVEFSPAYDFLNTTLALNGTEEEIALPLNGKKRNLKNRDLFEYFAIERLGLKELVVSDILKKIKETIPVWEAFIRKSFLSLQGKDSYLRILEKRIKAIDR